MSGRDASRARMVNGCGWTVAAFLGTVKYIDLNLLSLAKREDGILQHPDAGEPRGCGCYIEPAKLPNERRDALAVTVCLSGRPGKSWRRLDEDAEGNGVKADRDRGGHRIRRHS